MRDLVADLVADGVVATVRRTARSTVRAVTEQYERSRKPASNKQMAERLGMHPSTASRRLETAERKQYVRNLETKRGVEAKWVPGDALPGDLELLPPPVR